MRAIEVARFGGPEVLELRELPDPAPGPGEVLIAASACDVLFVDTLVRSGRATDLFPIRPPYVPGNGIGGTVVAVGAGVDPGWLERNVVAHTGGHGGTDGYAELAAVELNSCTPVPDGMELLDATAVLHDGTTALRVLELADVHPGERVLILGAGGGMGLLLVQLLAARGGLVVGAARGRGKREVIAEAGAERTVDYSEVGWTDAVLEALGGQRPEVVLDGVGGRIGQEAFAVLARGGHFSAHGSASGSVAVLDPHLVHAADVAVTSIADLQVDRPERARLLAGILEEVAAGRANPLIGRTFALAEASKAHQAIAARETVGKTVLLPERD